MKLSYNMNRPSAQGGFTLIELAITIGIIVLLAGAFIAYYNPAGSKGKTLYTMMEQTAGAADLFRSDVSCYPLKTGTLLEDPGKTNTNTSWCGNLSVGKNWKGPYVKSIPVENNALQLTNVSPDITLHIAKCVGAKCTMDGPTGTAVKVNTNGIGKGGPMKASNVYWMIVADNVPAEIAVAAVTACNGTEEISTNSANSKLQKCGMESRSPELGQVALKFAEGRGTINR